MMVYKATQSQESVVLFDYSVKPGLDFVKVKAWFVDLIGHVKDQVG